MRMGGGGEFLSLSQPSASPWTHLRLWDGAKADAIVSVNSRKVVAKRRSFPFLTLAWSVAPVRVVDVLSSEEARDERGKGRLQRRRGVYCRILGAFGRPRLCRALLTPPPPPPPPLTPAPRARRSGSPRRRGAQGPVPRPAKVAGNVAARVVWWWSRRRVSCDSTVLLSLASLYQNLRDCAAKASVLVAPRHARKQQRRRCEHRRRRCRRSCERQWRALVIVFVAQRLSLEVQCVPRRVPAARTKVYPSCGR